MADMQEEHEQAGSKQKVSPLTGYPPPVHGQWKPGQSGIARRKQAAPGQKNYHGK